MALPAVAHHPIGDADVAATPRVESERHDESYDQNDPLNPARGILLALALCVPFWIALLALIF